MYYVSTILLIFIILLIQYIRNRLLTSASLWVVFYFCFFGLSPILLNTQDNLAEQYAWWGLFSFFLGYMYILCVYTHKHISLQHYKPMKIGKTLIDTLVVLSLIMLVGYIGTEGVNSVLHGNLSSKMLMMESAGIFKISYFFLLYTLGYALVLCFVSQNAKFTLRQYFYFCIFAIQVILFSFTRAPLFLCVGMILVYKLRNFTKLHQIKYMLIIGILAVFMMNIMMWIRVFGLTEGIQYFTWERFISESTNNLDFAIGYEAFLDLIHRPVDVTVLIYFKPLFAAIPRSFWVTKPMRGTIEILWQLNSLAVMNGYSTGYTNLGVPFAVFGKAGIFLAPFTWGIVTSFLDENYIQKKNLCKDNDFYTVLYIFFMVTTVLQSFREGSDVALFNFVFVFIILFIISHWKLSFKFKT